ncbi:MAG TPA: hypothetical protein VFR81_19425 [Longimicrobium sp.]|nr:hypothetical protein [Longimicrobium sp.]
MMKKLLLTALLGVMMTGTTAQALLPVDGGGDGSTRRTVRCNTDGTYDCANENCNGVGCCNAP